MIEESLPRPALQDIVVTLTGKGQVTIPVSLRRLWGIGARDKLLFAIDADQVRLVPTRGLVAQTKGMLSGTAPVLSPDQETASVEDAMAEESGGEESLTIPFLDTNILLRHLRPDDPVLSPKATAILTKIERGELTARTADTVVFETVFSLQRGYKVPRNKIAQAVLPLLELPGIILPGKRAFRQVFERYCATPKGFADSYHLVMMRRLSLTEILTFDHDFDNISGVTRREE